MEHPERPSFRKFGRQYFRVCFKIDLLVIPCLTCVTCDSTEEKVTLRHVVGERVPLGVRCFDAHTFSLKVQSAFLLFRDLLSI